MRWAKPHRSRASFQITKQAASLRAGQVAGRRSNWSPRCHAASLRLLGGLLHGLGLSLLEPLPVSDGSNSQKIGRVENGARQPLGGMTAEDFDPLEGDGVAGGFLSAPSILSTTGNPKCSSSSVR